MGEEYYEVEHILHNNKLIKTFRRVCCDFYFLLASFNNWLLTSDADLLQS